MDKRTLGESPDTSSTKGEDLDIRRHQWPDFETLDLTAYTAVKNILTQFYEKSSDQKYSYCNRAKIMPESKITDVVEVLNRPFAETNLIVKNFEKEALKLEVLTYNRTSGSTGSPKIIMAPNTVLASPMLYPSIDEKSLVWERIEVLAAVNFNGYILSQVLKGIFRQKNWRNKFSHYMFYKFSDTNVQSLSKPYPFQVSKD